MKKIKKQTNKCQMKKWKGSFPEKCDICHQEIIDSFIYGRTKMGIWGIMCPTCHNKVGVGLGIGKGQSYAKADNASFHPR
jgi:hypothetical protein